MMSDRFRRAARVAAGTCAALMIAATAFAQSGQVRGKVLDDKGQPVADAKVTFDFKGNITRITETKTNRQGAFIQVGLQLGPYEVTVEKGDLKQTLTTKVNSGQTTELDFTLAPGGNTGAMSADDAKKLAEMRKALEDKYVAANALIEAEKYDEGIAALTALITETGGCAICEAKIGEALWKKGDEAGAEAAFKKAIAADPKQADAYNALASLYNQQKKFDQAAVTPCVALVEVAPQHVDHGRQHSHAAHLAFHQDVGVSFGFADVIFQIDGDRCCQKDARQLLLPGWIHRLKAVADGQRTLGGCRRFVGMSAQERVHQHPSILSNGSAVDVRRVFVKGPGRAVTPRKARRHERDPPARTSRTR